MKGKIVYYLFLLYGINIQAAHSQTYSPIAVTGFTHDIFAESGTSSLAVTTTDLDATNHIMYTTDFAATNGITGGVSPTGTFVSGTRTYQLAPYNQNNAIYLSLNGAVTNTSASNTLSLATPARYSRISFLSFSTEGTSTLNVILTFTDGSTFNAGNFLFRDWFDGTNFVISSIGRIARIASGPYTVDGLPSNPRWYAADIPISCVNQNKLLQSITISYISQGGTSGRAVALAVSGAPFTQLTASTATTPATCGGNNGTATVTATGGTAPLSYVWTSTPIQTTATATGLAAGPYTVSVTDANGCVSSFIDTVRQSAAITATAAATPTTICSGDSATLTATASNGNTGNTYTWSPGGLTGQSIRVGPTDTTTYTVTITDGGGCSTTATVTLPVRKKPVASFTALPQRFCLRNNDTITFTGTAGGTATYNWNFDNATIVSGSNAGPYILNFPTAGSHIVTLTVSENGCSSAQATQTVIADAPSTPTFSALPDSICSGDTVRVAFTGTLAAGATTNWNWGGGTVLSGTTTGPYVVRYTASGTIRLVINNNACTDSSTVKNINVTPLPTASFTPSALQACLPATISFTNTSQNGTSYTWNFGDNNTSNLQTPTPHSYTTAGTYNVTLTVVNGRCSASATPQTIRVFDPPVADFSSSPDVNATPIQLSQAQFNFTNNSTGATSYVWYFGDNDSSRNTNPFHRYTRAGAFTVTLYAYNSLGCFDSASKSPYIIIPDSSLRIPNAFSPNGDGVNDTWQIPGLLGYPDCRMDIFDRYGQPIFSSVGYNKPWDGRRNGKDVPIGTYYYVLRTSIRNYSGWVFIAR